MLYIAFDYIIKKLERQNYWLFMCLWSYFCVLSVCVPIDLCSEIFESGGKPFNINKLIQLNVIIHFGDEVYNNLF